MTNSLTLEPAHRGRSAVGPTPVRWPSVGLFLAATWLVSPLFLLLQSVLDVDNEVLSLVQFAPASAVLLVAALRRRSDPAVAGLLASNVRPDRQTGPRVGAGVALVAGVIGLGWAMTSLADHHLLGLHVHGLTHPLALILLSQFVGAAGEELGWRSFLLPYLHNRYASIVCVVIVGVVWATWHVQYYSRGPVFMAGFVTMCVAVTSIMMSCLAGTRGGSLYITTSVHWALNIGILLVLPIGDAHVRTMLCLAVAAVVVAVLAHRRASRTMVSSS